MFDDLNKMVPDLDEEDKSKIYDGLNAKSSNKGINIFKRQYGLILLGLALLAAIIVPIGIVLGNSSNNSEIDDPSIITPTEDNTGSYTGNTNHNTSFNERDIVGLAAYKEFDKHKNVKLTSKAYSVNEIVNNETVYDNNENKDNQIVFSYPFDYVRIHSAYKFSIKVDDIPNYPDAKEVIEKNCGFGELEVVVAEFSTYIDDNGNIREMISDILISFRGKNGYYTILENAASMMGNTATRAFSSHKQIGSGEIIKDFNPPIVTIFLRENKSNGVFYVCFKSDKNILKTEEYDQSISHENISAAETVDTATLYSTFELTEFKIKSIEVTVVEIYDDSSIEVESSCNISFVLIDSNTVSEGNAFVKTDDGYTLNFEAGAKLIVEYDELYTSYNPKIIVADKITLK